MKNILLLGLVAFFSYNFGRGVEIAFLREGWY